MNTQLGAPKIVTATANVKPIPCGLLGFFVSTTSSGTVILYDDAGTGTTTPISGTITPAAGAFYPFPAALVNGLYVVVSGTISATFLTF